MLLSIVLCTRNRAEQLGRTLRTAERMQRPAADWEILIVDNASTDRTAEVVAAFSGRLPIRRILEPVPGLSHARNRGLSEAQGRYICWTDDDVLVDRGWLAAYADAFRRHPGASFFGGRVEPVFDGEVPGWVSGNRDLLRFLMAERDLSPTELVFERGSVDLPFGANFAVRTDEQRRHRYDPELGVAPGRPRLGEETTVLLAILEAGGRGIWIPDALVRHVIPAERLTPRYVAAYFRSAGETWAFLARTGRPSSMGPPPAPGRRHLLGAPGWIWRTVLVKGASCHFGASRSITRDWLENWIHYNYMRGALRDFRTARREAAAAVPHPAGWAAEWRRRLLASLGRPRHPQALARVPVPACPAEDRRRA
ncbi:glycosyltransferase [Rhodobacter sp. CZR27]|uniref:glycosyltransferase n=1 Tax=Rhodobacter sp. CZR27 TaxID=2033869 RepID=UPI000BBEB968|nr:glycosyltransferase [Rhodobacter sp. CZR27]